MQNFRLLGYVEVAFQSYAVGGWVGGWSQVHNNATAWPNLGLLDSNQLDSKLGPSVAIMGFD